MGNQKKWGFIFIAIMMLWNLFPWNEAVPAYAEAKYFSFPNNQQLQSSTMQNPYIFNRGTIDLEGVFDEVQSSGLLLHAEQIYLKSDGTYAPIEGRSYSRDVTASSGNRFEAPAVTLFEGLNKITLSGQKAGVTLQDDFYIYFDSSPYLVDIMLRTNTDDVSPLNAGAGTVVTSADVFMEGTAPNATSLIINNQYTVQPLYDGTFFSPVLRLEPGKNTITIEVNGTNDQFTIERTVYYFNGEQLVFEGAMYFDYNGDGIVSSEEKANTKPVVGTTSTFAVPFSREGSGDLQGGFAGKIMVPYVSATGLTPADITAILDGDAARVSNIEIDNKSPVRYGNDHSITYEVYDIRFDVFVDTSDQQSLTHSLELETIFGGVQGADTILFNFANNDNRIVEDVQWLYSYDEQETTPNTHSKRPLQNAQIHSSTIYVEVTKNKPFVLSGSDQDQLEAYLTPYDPNQALTVTNISWTANANKAIYKIDNIPPGSHMMVLNFVGSPNVYDYLARVDYVSGAHALFLNVFDGMTIKAQDRPEKLEMMIRNVDTRFDPKANGNASLSINGVAITNAFQTYTKPNTAFTVDLVDGNGNSLLRFGENRLQVQLRYDGFVTTKEIRMYVSDDQLPMIEMVKPVIPPTSGSRPSLSSESDRQQMYKDMSGLIYENDVYFTTAFKYDLVMEVSNFQKFQLQYDGEYMIDFDKENGSVDLSFPAQTSAGPDKDWVHNKRIDRHYDAIRDRLIVRVRDLEFPGPGSQIFQVNIAGRTGSQAQQSFEIVREEVPYTVLSPVATTDNKIIVNKNFVQVRIQAENADEVIIGKDPAANVSTSRCSDCFELEYIGLREDRWNTIKFSVLRGDDEVKGEIEVYYANSLTSGAQYKETLDRRMRVFDRSLQLQFDRGTLLQTEISNRMVPSLYEEQRILFGIADPETGLVEHMTDDGTIKSPKSALSSRFNNFKQDFTFISPVYWIHGGLAEKGTPGTSGYRSSANGLPPHNEDTALTYTYTDPARNLIPNKRGELTLSYDPIVREAAGIEVTVFHFDKNGNWTNLGGVINTRRHEITVPFDQFGYYVVAKLRYNFPDIQSHRWAGDVLKAIYSKGFMASARVFEFGADDYMTRGEYAQLLVKALQLPLNYDDRSSFIDVQYGSRYGDLWEYKYIETAARAGIIQGIQERVFAPNQTLTREQAAVMIARALELKLPLNDQKLEDKLKKAFTDADRIHYYAQPSVMAVYSSKIMLGETTVSSTGASGSYVFNPKANLTRAQAAAIAVRVMQSELNYFPKNLN